MFLMLHALVLLALPLLTAQEQPSQDEIRALIERLGSDEADKRAEAAAALRSIGEAARSVLAAVRDHADLEIRQRVRGLIGELDWNPVLPPFLDRWDSSAAETLRTGPRASRFALIRDLHGLGAIPPCLAERVVLTIPDPNVHALVARL